jgi:hypothetical protein
MSSRTFKDDLYAEFAVLGKVLANLVEVETREQARSPERDSQPARGRSRSAPSALT